MNTQKLVNTISNETMLRLFWVLLLFLIHNIHQYPHINNHSNHNDGSELNSINSNHNDGSELNSITSNHNDDSYIIPQHPMYGLDTYDGYENDSDAYDVSMNENESLDPNESIHTNESIHFEQSVENAADLFEALQKLLINGEHPLHDAYESLMEDTKADHQSAWCPWHNECHMCLHLSSVELRWTDQTLQRVIDILHVLEHYDWFTDDEKRNIIRSLTLNQIKEYMKSYLPQFEMKQTRIQIPIQSKTQNVTGDKSTDRVEFGIDVDISDFSEEKGLIYEEQQNHHFDATKYSNHHIQLRTIYTFPLQNFLAWNCLNFSQFPLYNFNFVNNSDIYDNDARILSFNETEFVRKHLIYESGNYLFPLKNGTVIYLYSLLQIESDPNMIYWVTQIQHELNPVLIQYCTQGSNQCRGSIADSPNTVVNDLIDPYIILHVWECGQINDDEWIITKKQMQLDPIKVTDKIHIANVEYSSIKYQCDPNGNPILLEAHEMLHGPLFQNDLVKYNGMQFFGTYSGDAISIYREFKGYYCAYFYIANQIGPKTEYKAWRYSIIPPEIPFRYIIHILCSELRQLSKKFLCWTVDDELNGYQLRFGQLNLCSAICDSADRCPLQLTVQPSADNRYSGRTTVNALKNGPGVPEGYQDVNNLKHTFSWQTKSKLHRMVHKIVKDQDLRTSTIFSTSLGVSNSPFGVWHDLDGHEFKWNFVSLCPTEFYHSVCSGLHYSMFESVEHQFYFKNLPQIYDLLIQEINQTNETLHVPSKYLKYSFIKKQGRMELIFIKFLFISSVLTVICHWDDATIWFVYLHILFTKMIQISTENERIATRDQIYLILKILWHELGSIVNKPKWRYLKEILDHDFRIWNKLHIFEGIYTERLHQLFKLLIQKHSNHLGGCPIEQIMNHLGKRQSLKYVFGGGVWGNNFRCKIGHSILNPRSNKLTSILSHWIGPRVYEMYNESNYNDNINYSQYRQSKITKIHCKYYESCKEYTLTQFLKKIEKHQQQLAFNNLKHVIINEIGQNPFVKIKTCYKLCFWDEFRSNFVTGFHQNGDVHEISNQWFCWIKICHNNTQYIMNLCKIYLCSWWTEDEQHIKYLGFGNIYQIQTKKFSNPNETQIKYINQSRDIKNLCDSFDKSKPCPNKRWIQLSDATLIETVLVTHDHIPQLVWLIDAEKSYKRNIFAYRRFYHNPLKMDTPCGPIYVCKKYKHPWCTQCYNSKKVWIYWCNKNKSTIYIIWDSDTGWIPSLHFAHLKREMPDEDHHFFQPKPPGTLLDLYNYEQFISNNYC